MRPPRYGIEKGWSVGRKREQSREERDIHQQHAKCALRKDRSPAQSFTRSLTHSLAREKRDERGSRLRKTTTTRRREKREERREKREERRQKTDPKRPPEVRK